MMVRWPVFVIFFLWISIFTYIVSAAADDVILVIEGPAGGEPVTFTEKQIRLMPKKTFLTYDPWDRRERKYTGVPLATLLKHIGKLDEISVLDVIGRNKYSVKITMNDVTKYDHLISYEMNGEDYSTLKDDNKGPLAIALKMEDVEPDDTIRLKNQFVWWVEKIVIR